MNGNNNLLKSGIPKEVNENLEEYHATRPKMSGPDRID
jgi:hypothetical protein